LFYYCILYPPFSCISFVLQLHIIKPHRGITISSVFFSILLSLFLLFSLLCFIFKDFSLSLSFPFLFLTYVPPILHQFRFFLSFCVVLFFLMSSNITCESLTFRIRISTRRFLLVISFPPGKSTHFTLKQATTTSVYTLSK